MQVFKKSTAWALVLCLILSLALSVAPVAAEGEPEVAAVDTYVFYYRPAADQYPAYYERYARPYMLYSGHTVRHHAMDENGYLSVRFFNVVNTAALIEDESKAPAGGYATSGAFCSDAETYIIAGSAYRRMNLEDGYFNSNPDTLEGTVDARKIRAVLRNSMPNLADLPAFEKKINTYLTATYGEEALLVSGLTGTQLTSAAQAAIWHYANGFDFSSPYPYKGTDNFASWDEHAIANTSAKISYPDYPANFMDAANETTAANMNGVYQYLLSLPGEDPRERVLTADAVSLADAVISGSGDNCVLTALVDIDGTINDDDQLVLSVKCGEQTQTFSLGASNTLAKLDNGLYAVNFSGVSEEDCTAVELVLSGEQIIDDVCFFEAKPTEDTNARKAGYLKFSVV